MNINLDKINAALDRLDPEKKSTGHSGDRPDVKLPEGETTIRLVPYKYDLEMPFHELHFHYNVAGKTFPCPQRMKGDSCEICEVATKMWRKYESSNDETYKDAFKKLVATSRAYIPCVVRGEEEKGVRWWVVNTRTTYKEILTVVKNAAKSGLDITDTEAGRDLVVTVEKGWNDYLIPKSVQSAFADSKLAKTKKETDALIDTVTKIEELYTFREPEEMTVALNSYFSDGSTNRDPDSAGKTADFSTKEPADGDLIDFGGSKSVEDSVSDKFDKVVAGD
tara:strand:+ start:1490 stop:2326 length:837 start_codon:yes stop_codon:yes gene_type:complete